MPKHDPIPPKRRPPDYERAADAWARYKQTMKWMAVVAVVCVLLALIYLKSFGEPVPIHMLIATIAGVGLMVMVGTGLMGLISCRDVPGMTKKQQHGDWNIDRE